MAFSEGIGNIAGHYRWELRLSGALPQRLAYVTAYFLLFTALRWGDRHGRAERWLNRLGFSLVPVDVKTPEGVRLRVRLHTAFDPVYSIYGERDYDYYGQYLLPEGGVAIDAGANVGVYTTLAAQKVGAKGQVVAIEPHPGNLADLKANVERNGFANVRFVQAAADDHEGEAELFLHERNVNHSLVRPTDRSIRVPVRTLDSLVRELGLSRVDVLKIDIEGNVPALLRGARELLRRQRPVVVYERDEGAEGAGSREEFERAGYEVRDRSAFTYAWPKERGPLVPRA